jgi:hypothetical protein
MVFQIRIRLDAVDPSYRKVRLPSRRARGATRTPGLVVQNPVVLRLRDLGQIRPWEVIADLDLVVVLSAFRVREYRFSHLSRVLESFLAGTILA